ncbi:MULTISPECIES: LPD7 domain-containing protein [Thiomonas]|uniref:Toprim domain-containing protein n=1 Tax=Thiomonas arsenitoxydans (strain DSM 22701 / CIP 110005 / 3As) TaxID=426114 RepID=A0A8I1SXH7_THIA3|nr:MULTISPECIES: LPD7 domain-containing protein [Thiomonas]CQR44777.1 conserved hypothetical protein [Thiomonas sp. CB3]MBN8744624.1 toprim domain-containing protein [Thiomonas arsenitoxydans]ODU91909.1 MAG: DNA primase [Thiomonas sp. SCN 64-16]CDW92549.1 conserved hypothetical protein [Thiomonas sp. CB2]VDY05755.1 conserved protein of unknown function [Thiomonas sp. Bio17B3]
MDTTQLTPFLDFARLHDVHIDPQRLQVDGRIHRADVGDRPNGRNDAAYLLRDDGTGWVTNFKADGKPIAFRPELARESTPEEQQKAQAERTAWLQQQAERQKAALTDSLTRWEASHEPCNFPYLQNPALPTAGLRQHSAQLLVPMLKLTDGEPEWVGMQRIAWAAPGQSADKRFVAGTPTQGAFAVIPIDGQDAEAPLRAFETAKTAPHIVMCEGIGTALALHQATGLPVIAALSAQNLPEVARTLHEQVQGRVTLYADNDGERAARKGQINALKAARILGGARTTIALPEKPNGVTPPGYDARDQLRDSGPESIRNTLDRAVPPWTFQRSHPSLAPPTGQGRQPKPPIPHLKQEQSMEPQAETEPTPHIPSDEPVPVQQAVTAQRTEFADLNAALERVESEQEPKPQPQQKETEVSDAQKEEAALLNAWRESAQPAREQRAKAWQDLNAQQQAARESLFSTLAQQRAETLKSGGDLDVHAFESAKQIEHLQKTQAAQRKTLASSLPLPPTLREFLEPRAEHDPIAARLLEQEKTRDPSQESIRGRRVAALESEVLDGLTHDIEDGPPKAVHYARDGEKVMTDRGERVDLYHVDDREIESALRLAEQKYDMDKGLQFTGSREFQERAAEIAGRMGLKVQNPELQQTWQLGRLQTLQSEELGADTRLTAPAVGQGAIESARPERGGDGRTYAVDTKALQAEALLAKLDIHGFDAIDRASRYQPLTPDQRTRLQGHDEQTRLIDDQDRLTPLGQQVTERMWAKIETEREQLQQQLRTRNIEEELKKREAQEEKQERTEDKAQDKAVEREIVAHERAEERAEEREPEAPQRAPVRPRSRQPSRDMGLGG